MGLEFKAARSGLRLGQLRYPYWCGVARSGLGFWFFFIYKMLHWINWIVLLSLEPLAGELKYASVVWSVAGAWAGRVSNV